ncbi:hypothetical protein PAMP_017089 [Pampus punctatissimus]
MEFHENTSTSDLDETKVDFTETNLQNCNMSEENEKLKVKSPKMLEKETQTSSVWQEIEDANKVLQQEKTAWEEEKKTLYQKIAEASDTKSCNEERDTIHKEAENANQQSDSNKIETYTRENELRDQLEEMELLQRFDKLLLEQQNLELEALRKRVNELEKLQQLEWELDGRVEEEEGTENHQELHSWMEEASLEYGDATVYGRWRAT